MPTKTDNQTSADRAGRAWWQWVLGIGFLAAAAAIAVMRYVPGMRPMTTVRTPYREIVISDALTPVETVPADPGDFRDHNLLIVTFDTTRADRIGCYGFDQNHTPMFDRLAHEGVLFGRTIAPAPVTLPSHSSIMTGLYPYRHGARANSWLRLDDSNLTLAEILRARGYATAAMVSAAILDDRYGIGQGFAVYDDEVERIADPSMPHVVPERPADETVDRAEAWLRAHDAEQPFFLWVHFYDPHYPREPPPPFDTQYAHAYVGEIAFADQQLARLLGIFDELDLTDTTLTVVAGDHGEGLGQHDEVTHSLLIYDSVMHVPMVMRCGTRLGGGAHLSRPVSLVDIMPTVLSLLGVDVPEDLDGFDLTAVPPDDRPIYTETLEGLIEQGCAALLGVYEGPLKYIHGPQVELYDVTEDPFEQENLVAGQPDTVERLRSRLEGFFGDDLEKAATAEPTETLNPEELAQLQALGYLGGAAGHVPPPTERKDPKKLVIEVSAFYRLLEELRELPIESSIPVLQKFCVEHPELLNGWQRLARNCTLAGDLDCADEALRQCLDLRPDLPSTHLELARLNIRQSKLEDAGTFFELALEHAPGHYEALNELGQLRMAQGRVAEASELFERALESWPESPTAPELLASTLPAQGRTDEAIAIMERHLENRAKLPIVSNALARLLTNQGRYTEAMEVLRAGAELSPDYYDLPNNLAYLLTNCPDVTLRSPVEAVVIMQQLCDETSHGHPRYLHTLSLCYANMFRLEDAIAVAEKALEIASSSKNPEFARMAPSIGISLENYRQAQASGISPTNPPKPKPQPGDDQQGGTAAGGQ